ncbi:hypothetical protein PG993_003876 [Apiospora rasikravindrae]|uniref:Ankyrin n=1 Tax=Apiospora rasikravindrae TaxID=990691 RepID=A0ABR1U2Z3_9PEZI
MEWLHGTGFTYTRPVDLPKTELSVGNPTVAPSTDDNKSNWSLVWDGTSREFHFYNASTGAKQLIDTEQGRPIISNASHIPHASSPPESHLPSLHQLRDALQAALLAGYDHAVSQLLLRYDEVDINTPLFWTPTSTSTTPLQWAVAQDNLELVQLLLKSYREGTEGPPRDRVTGTRALGQAVDNQNTAIATALLAHGVRCDFEDSDRPCPYYGGININNFSPHDESEPAEYIPPLVRAVRHGHVELVQLLLAHGADPNIGYHDLWPPGAGREKELTWDREEAMICFTCGRPVQLAMELGFREVVEVLLDHGAVIELPQPVWGVPGHQCEHVYRCSKGYHVSGAIVVKPDRINGRTGLLTAIAIILAQVNGRPQEEWTFQVTLNSLINILSTLFRACLAATAAEIISQQKWIWFWTAPTSGRPIRQVQAFEEGSRSLLGALYLLPIVAIQHPAIILPIVTLTASLAIGPFAQQSIRTIYQEIPSALGSASLTISNSLNSTDFYFRTFGSADYVSWTLKAGPRSIVFNALASPNSKDAVITPICPTGNCTFPILSPHNAVTHTSLGVCSVCTDVSSLVQEKANETWRPDKKLYTLPNRMELFTYDTTTWLSVASEHNLAWAEGLMTAKTAALARWAFVNTTVLTMSLAGLPNDQHTGVPATPIATTCSLYACVHSYSASVRNNELSEVIVDSTPLAPDFETYHGLKPETIRWEDLITNLQNYSLAAIQPVCKIDENIYTLANVSQSPDAKPVTPLVADASPGYPKKFANEGCITRIEDLAFTLIGGAYSNFLNGTCAWDRRNGNEIACYDRWWLAPFWENKNASVKSITNHFDAIAGATTNQIRLGLLRTPGTPDRVNGMALRQVAYTRIEWVWLTLPAALLAIDIVMLAWMVIRSVRHQDTEAVWKSNPLPLLYYKSRFVGPTEPEKLFLSAEFDPLETPSPNQDDKLLTSSELATVAKTVKVHFRTGPAQVKDPGGEEEHAGGDSQQLDEPLSRVYESEGLLPEAR